jgi:hypothetical protein
MQHTLFFAVEGNLEHKVLSTDLDGWESQLDLMDCHSTRLQTASRLDLP